MDNLEDQDIFCTECGEECLGNEEREAGCCSPCWNWLVQCQEEDERNWYCTKPSIKRRR